MAGSINRYIERSRNATSYAVGLVAAVFFPGCSHSTKASTQLTHGGTVRLCWRLPVVSGMDNKYSTNKKWPKV